MKKTMKKMMFVLLLVLPAVIRGQGYESRIYRAYVTGRMDRWKEVMNEIERTYLSTGNQALLFELADAEYGYIAYLLSEGRKKEARKILEKAERHVDRLLRSDPGNPVTYSLLGALYGFRISLEPLKAPFYGRKSVDANEKALELGPEEPRAWLEKANIEFYKPAIFGGSKKEAVVLYEKAVRLFESSPGRTENNWIYLNSLIALATAYEETEAVGKADRVYRKMLELEPDLLWIREEVYPDFREKHSLE